VSRLRRVIGAHDWIQGVRVYYLKKKMHTVTDSPDSLNLSPTSPKCFKVVPLKEVSMYENSHTRQQYLVFSPRRSQSVPCPLFGLQCSMISPVRLSISSRSDTTSPSIRVRV
jgi:hypothetical protein